jgi:hypothetical protein
MAGCTKSAMSMLRKLLPPLARDAAMFMKLGCVEVR